MIRNCNYKNLKIQKGSVSLLLAILIPAILFLSLGLAELAKILNQETKINRLIDLYGESVLANYDRDLLDRYGIYAFSDSSSFELEATEQLKEEGIKARITLNPFNSTNENEELLRQISEFTRLRIPSKIILEKFANKENITKTYQEYKTTTSDFKNIIKTINNLVKKINPFILNSNNKLKVENELFNSLNKNPSLNLLRNLDDSRKALIDLNKSKKVNKVKLHSSDLIKDINKKIPIKGNINNEELNDVDDYKASMSDWDEFISYLNEHNKYDEVFSQELDIQSDNKGLFGGLTSILDNFDKITSVKLPIFIEKIILSEFILNQFSSRFRGPDSPNPNDKTLTGQKMSELFFTSNLEAEMAILGDNSEFWSKLKVNSFIISLRLISNYIEIFNDPVIITNYRAIATTLSTAIAVISLGSIIISPEILTQIFIFLNAFSNSYRDYKTLLDGDSVQIYSGKSNLFSKINMNYLDHLRILSLFIPLNKQLNVVNKVIKENFNKYFYYKIDINISYSTPYWESKLRKSYAYAQY